METIEQIMIDEGYRENVYLCPAGKLTWLFGRNIEDRPISTPEWNLLRNMLSEGKTMRQWAAKLLKIECTSLVDGFDRHDIILKELPNEVAAILLNMGYNMGLTTFNPKKWPNFFREIEERNWGLAAIAGIDSRWYNQVGQRSKRLMKAMAAVKED